MDYVDSFIRNYFWVFVLLSLADLIRRLVRHCRKGIRFPALNTVHVRFHESGASGNSNKSLFSRLGGASRCLRVTVTDTEVWIRSFFPFSLIMESDLGHKISLSDITSARMIERAFGRPRVVLEFSLPDGNSRQLSLTLRNPSAFLTALSEPGTHLPL
ncbi:MAG TPA: hypothetical protein VG796_27345 [Verrucomicrobiales bacterium]|jgi:hypothetical protein|nr:hypothetical protein [Verrucomicrobiales bacterium]